MTAFKQVLTDALNRSRQWLRKRMPVILQDEMSECGIACIAMISSYYGKNLSLRDMRQHYRVARDGMSLLQVVKMCEEHNLISRPLRLTLANTVHLRTPSILFWNNRHYVVLESTNARGLHIVDPAVGRRFYTWAQALTMFSSIALEVQPSLSFTTKAKGTAKQSLSFTLPLSIATSLPGALLSKRCLINILPSSRALACALRRCQRRFWMTQLNPPAAFISRLCAAAVIRIFTARGKTAPSLTPSEISPTKAVILACCGPRAVSAQRPIRWASRGCLTIVWPPMRAITVMSWVRG